MHCSMCPMTTQHRFGRPAELKLDEFGSDIFFCGRQNFETAISLYFFTISDVSVTTILKEPRCFDSLNGRNNPFQNSGPYTRMTLHQKTFLFSFVVQFYFSRRTPKLGTRGLGGVGGDDNFALGREGSPCGPPPPPRGPPPPPRGPPILVRLSLRWLKRVGAVVTGEGRRKATMIRRQIVEAKPINFILRCSPAAWLPETIKSTQLSRQATKPMRASSCEGQAAWMLKCLLPKLENPCRLYISVALRVADPAYSGIAYMVRDKS